MTMELFLKEDLMILETMIFNQNLIYFYRKTNLKPLKMDLLKLSKIGSGAVPVSKEENGEKDLNTFFPQKTRKVFDSLSNDYKERKRAVTRALHATLSELGISKEDSVAIEDSVS